MQLLEGLIRKYPYIYRTLRIEYTQVSFALLPACLRGGSDTLATLRLLLAIILPPFCTECMVCALAMRDQLISRVANPFFYTAGHFSVVTAVVLFPRPFRVDEDIASSHQIYFNSIGSIGQGVLAIV